MNKIIAPVLIGGLLAFGSIGCQGGQNGEEDGFLENGENGYYEDEERGLEQNGENGGEYGNGEQDEWLDDTVDGMDTLDDMDTLDQPNM